MAVDSATHQLAQDGLIRLLLRDLSSAWHVLDVAKLKASIPRFTAVVAGVTHRYASMSAGLAAQHYRQERRHAGAGGSFTVPLAPKPALSQISTAVDWSLKPLWSTTPDVLAAQTQVDGAVEKMVLDTGRDTIIDAARQDKAAKGYARVTEAHPCAFCAMLAVRGAVYKSAESASFESHDHCRCHATPVFNAYEPPANVRGWQALYAQSTKGESDKLNAFRRAFDTNSAA